MAQSTNHSRMTARRWGMVGGGIIAIVLLAGGLVWTLGPAPIPAAGTLKPLELAKVISTSRFGQLSDQQKIPYAKALFSLDPHNAAAMIKSLTPKEQNEAFKNLGYVLLTQTADGYFNLKAPQQRTIYLDRVLDWVNAVDQAERQMPDVRNVSHEESKKAAEQRVAMARGWVEGLAPSQSARMAEFYKQLVLRRTARHFSLHGW